MTVSPSLLDRLNRWFDSYRATFPSTDMAIADALAMKHGHCRQVSEESQVIARGLGLGDREVLLAAVAGLLHDVARFEQFSRFRTFVDARSYNHGQRGAQIIAEQALLAGLEPPDAAAVTEAVRHHNGLAVPDGLSETGGLLVRIVRDADKLDIYRVAVGVYTGTERNSAVELELPDAPGVSPAIAQAILDGRMARMDDLRSLNDFKLLQMAWIADVNFAPTLRLIAERGYLETIRRTLPDLPEVEQVYRKVMETLARARAGRQ